MSNHIGVLIPSTTRNRPWKTLEETTLFSIFIPSFFSTYCNKFKYTIYLVIDDDDPILTHVDVQEQLKKYTK